MLSGRLIHLIEAHQEEIATRVLHDVRRHQDLPHIHKLEDLELRERGRRILGHLGKWLGEAREAELAIEYEILGKLVSRRGSPCTNRFAPYISSRTR